MCYNKIYIIYSQYISYTITLHRINATSVLSTVLFLLQITSFHSWKKQAIVAYRLRLITDSLQVSLRSAIGIAGEESARVCHGI